MRVILFCTLCVFQLFIAACSDQPENPAKSTKAGSIDVTLLVQEYVDPAVSTLLVKRLSDGQLWISGPNRLDVRFPAASTSKIPHTLIALETETANAETKFVWDGRKRTFEMWNRDQTLSTAFKRSAVWVYQQIATDIGADEMARWIEKLGYGNENTGGPEDLTTYWLNGTLKIAAREQVEFLEKFITGKLQLSISTYEAARPLFLYREGDEWALYSKTGWYFDESEIDIGWYVGWLEVTKETDPEIYLFAFNMDMPIASDRGKRKSVVHKVLTQSTGILELEK